MKLTKQRPKHPSRYRILHHHQDTPRHPPHQSGFSLCHQTHQASLSICVLCVLPQTSMNPCSHCKLLHRCTCTPHANFPPPPNPLPITPEASILTFRSPGLGSGKNSSPVWFSAVYDVFYLPAAQKGVEIFLGDVIAIRWIPLGTRKPAVGTGRDTRGYLRTPGSEVPTGSRLHVNGSRSHAIPHTRRTRGNLHNGREPRPSQHVPNYIVLSLFSLSKIRFRVFRV